MFHCLRGTRKPTRHDRLQSTFRFQRLLPAAVLVAPAVAFARKIYPLRVTKLVSHKIEVSFAAQGVGNQSDHLVQGQATVNDSGARAELAHVVVHFLVHQPERERLVTDQRLVVTLRVRDRQLLVTAATSTTLTKLSQNP
jgi:hypothetical protein